MVYKKRKRRRTAGGRVRYRRRHIGGTLFRPDPFIGRWSREPWDVTRGYVGGSLDSALQRLRYPRRRLRSQR